VEEFTNPNASFEDLTKTFSEATDEIRAINEEIKEKA